MEIILDHLVHFTDRHPLEAAEFFKKQGLTAVMGAGMRNGARITAFVISATSPIWSSYRLKTGKSK